MTPPPQHTYILALYATVSAISATVLATLQDTAAPIGAYLAAAGLGFLATGILLRLSELAGYTDLGPAVYRDLIIVVVVIGVALGVRSRDAPLWLIALGGGAGSSLVYWLWSLGKARWKSRSSPP